MEILIFELKIKAKFMDDLVNGFLKYWDTCGTGENHTRMRYP